MDSFSRPAGSPPPRRPGGSRRRRPGGLAGFGPAWARSGWAHLILTALYAVALSAILQRGWDRRMVWRTQLVDKGIGGDGIQYWAMAVNLERAGMISLDGQSPTWLRLPGYPALLRYTTRPAESADGPKDPKAIQLRVDAWIKRAVKVNLLVDMGCAVAGFFLALALGAGPIALVAPAAWAYQPMSSVVAIHTLSDPLATLVGTLALAALVHAVRATSPGWLAIAGAISGAAQYIRPDAILLVPALLVAGVAIAGWRRPVIALVGVVVWGATFMPWPMRNYRLFHEAHPLGAMGVDAKGKPIDRGPAYAWIRTWCTGGETETVKVVWRLPGATLKFDDLPTRAYDNAEEIEALKSFLSNYNVRGGRLDSGLTEALQKMADTRRANHPLDYWVRLPLARMKARLLPPRDGFGLGTLPTLRDHREEWQGADRRVTLLGLAALLLMVVRPETRGAALAVAAWLAGRLLLMGWIAAPEPRYFLQALPVLLALSTTLPATGADALLTLWSRRRP